MMMELFGGEVAPQSAETPYRCRECGRYLDAVEEFSHGEEFFLCHETGLECDIRHSSAQFLETENIKNAVWYHATSDMDWITNITNRDFSQTPMVHVGTKETAYEVLYQKYRNAWDKWGDPAAVYTLRLKDGISISDEMHEDTNMWPDYVYENDGGDHAYPYVNIYEFPGAVSLLIDPRYLEVVEVTVFGEDRDVRESVEKVIPAGRLTSVKKTDFTNLYLL